MMDWQQAVSLGLVLGAAAFLIISRLRARSTPSCGHGCVCPSDHQGTPPSQSSPAA